MLRRLLLSALAVLAVAALPRPADAWVRTLSCCRDARTVSACRGELDAALRADGDPDGAFAIDIERWFGWPAHHVPNATCTAAQLGLLPPCECEERPFPLTWHALSCWEDADAPEIPAACAVPVPLESREDLLCWSDAIGYLSACAPGQAPQPGPRATACLSWFLNEQGLARTPRTVPVPDLPLGGEPWPADVARVDPDDPREIPLDALQGILARSFATWNEVECSQVEARFAGFTSARQIGTRGGQQPDFKNVVVLYREGWPHAPLVQGLTSVTYDRQGSIVDADIELNATTYELGVVGDAPEDRGLLDIENTMTHEVGHLFGLDHSLSVHFLGFDTTACELGGTPPEGLDCASVRPDRTTMFATASPGETFKRELHPDDEAGLCAIYPADGPLLVCDPDPDRPRPDPPRRGCEGCAAGAGPAGPLAFVGLLFGLRRRRRR